MVRSKSLEAFLGRAAYLFAKEVKEDTRNFRKHQIRHSNGPLALAIINNPKLKEALEENYEKVGRLIERYGTPDQYVVLDFCKDASIEENQEIYFNLEDALEREMGKVLILPKGKGFKKHHDGLKKLGLFRFDKENDYHTLLKPAKKYGRLFEIGRYDGVLGYREWRGHRVEYRKILRPSEGQFLP